MITAQPQTFLSAGRCEECGKTFTVKIKCPAPNPRRFCSRRCAARSYRRTLRLLPTLPPEPVRCAFAGCSGLVSVRRQRYRAKYCVSRHKVPKNPRPLASTIVQQRSVTGTDYELDLKHTCGSIVVPQTEDGVLVDWCPTCRVAVPVPTRGRRVYDQREDHDAELTASVKRAQTAIPLPVSHTSAGMKRINVGQRDPNDGRRAA